MAIARAIRAAGKQVSSVTGRPVRLTRPVRIKPVERDPPLKVKVSQGAKFYDTPNIKVAVGMAIAVVLAKLTMMVSTQSPLIIRWFSLSALDEWIVVCGPSSWMHCGFRFSVRWVARTGAHRAASERIRGGAGQSEAFDARAMGGDSGASASHAVWVQNWPLSCSHPHWRSPKPCKFAQLSPHNSHMDQFNRSYLDLAHCIFWSKALEIEQE